VRRAEFFHFGRCGLERESPRLEFWSWRKGGPITCSRFRPDGTTLTRTHQTPHFARHDPRSACIFILFSLNSPPPPPRSSNDRIDTQERDEAQCQSIREGRWCCPVRGPSQSFVFDLDLDRDSFITVTPFHNISALLLGLFPADMHLSTPDELVSLALPASQKRIHFDTD